MPLTITEFPLAPLAEQRRIVAEIEKQLTRLDAGVAALKRVQATLRRFRTSVLKATCEGRLVPTEAELTRVGAEGGVSEGGAPRGGETPPVQARRGEVISPQPYEPADRLLARILAERRTKWEAEHPGKKYVKPARPETDGCRSCRRGGVGQHGKNSLRVSPWVCVGPMKHEYQESGVPFLRSQNVRESGFDAAGLCRVSREFHQKICKSVLHPR